MSGKVPATTSWLGKALSNMADASAQVEELSAQVSGISGVQQTCIEDIATNKGNIESTQSAIQELENSMEGLTGSTGPIGVLQSEMLTVTGAISGLSGAVASNKSAISGLSGAVAANASGVSGLTAQYATYGTVISGLSGAVAANTSQISGVSGTLSTHIATTNNQHYNLQCFGTFNNTNQIACNGSGVPTQIISCIGSQVGPAQSLSGSTISVTLPNGTAQTWPAQFTVANGTDGVYNTITSGNHGITLKDIWVNFIAYQASSSTSYNYYPFIAVATCPAMTGTNTAQTYTIQRVLCFGTWTNGFTTGQGCVGSATNLNYSIPAGQLVKLVCGFATNGYSDTRYMYFIGNTNYTVNNP